MKRVVGQTKIEARDLVKQYRLGGSDKTGDKVEEKQWTAMLSLCEGTLGWSANGTKTEQGE